MNQHQSQMLNQLQNQPPMVNQPIIPQPQMIDQSKMMCSNYGQWSHPPPMNPVKFRYPMNNKVRGGIPKPGPSGWMAKKSSNNRKDIRWKDSMDYQLQTLNVLEQQNKLNSRRYYRKKRFNRMVPYAHAPRNTTSYIIRAKKSGGIASLVSPCPVTPAVLPTPVFSPSREALVEMAKEEWGVDGYGSMKGLIRLRSPGHDETLDDYDEDDEDDSSESDVEEYIEVERRLDHNLSRFEMICPSSGIDHHNVLENRVDDQDTHIAQLEEENLILKERLYLMEKDVGEMRRRLLYLERKNQVSIDINEDVVLNVSKNDSDDGFKSVTLHSNRHNQEVDSMPRNGAEQSGSRMDCGNCDEMMHKDSGEIVMKEDFAEENNQEGEQVQGIGLVQKEQQESRDNEGDGSELKVSMIDGCER